MRLLALLLTVLATSTRLAAAQAWCEKQDNVPAPGQTTYAVRTTGIEGDYASLCAGLQGNLTAGRPECVPARAVCGLTSGQLQWNFVVDSDCHGGLVAAAVSAGLRSKIGNMQCLWD